MVFCDIWQDDRVERLKQLFDTNLRTAEIAARLNEEFGTSLSRCAVIGKLHRLKLLYPKAVPQPKKPRARKPSALVPRLAGAAFVPRVVNVSPRMIPFAELRPGECQYECSGQDLQTSEVAKFLFCGNPVKAGSRFCIQCHAVCWEPPYGRFSRAA